jgi:hypothetical protein
MSAEAERRGWVRGYRAALDDMEQLGTARITAWYSAVIRQLAEDLREIDSVGKRRAQLGRLRERVLQAEEAHHGVATVPVAQGGDGDADRRARQ